MNKWIARQWSLFVTWPYRRFASRYARNEPHTVIQWRPGPYPSLVPNSRAPEGWWPVTVQLKPYTRPQWWRIESRHPLRAKP